MTVLAVLVAQVGWGQSPAQRQSALARQRLAASLVKAEEARAFVANVRGEVERLSAAELEAPVAGRIATAEGVIGDARGILADRSAEAGAMQIVERRVVAQAGELQRLQRELAARVGSLRNRQRLVLDALEELRRRGAERLATARPTDGGGGELRRLTDLAARVDEQVPVPELERLRADLDRGLAALAPQAAPPPSRTSTVPAGIPQARGAALSPEPTRSSPRQASSSPSRSSSASSPASSSTASPPTARPAEPTVFDPVPFALEESARALFGADYGRALRSLDSVPTGGPRVEVARYLLGAAASFALYQRNGEREPQLLESARQQVAACRQLAPELDLSGLPFSPRFVQFFGSVPPAVPTVVDLPAPQ
ncbi:MAG TPA: hypothetical protein VNB06_04855 [Thermoanaerobaculia bacterium]|nr:hypothetical protein [Thermoanaerobaculia bacterium]